MSADRLGFVVIEWNQASHQPEVVDYTFTTDLDVARDEVAVNQARLKATGRRERYSIAEVVELEDGSDV